MEENKVVPIKDEHNTDKASDIIDVHPQSWMALISNDTPVMSLILAGTHNSGAYLSKNFLWWVKDYTLCQNYCVKDQLLMGVRFLDLRISLYKETDTFSYYITHAFVLVPLLVVIVDLWEFLNENPSETVFLLVKPGSRVWNVDLFQESQTVKLNNKDMPAVAEWIEKVFNTLNEKHQL